MQTSKSRAVVVVQTCPKLRRMTARSIAATGARCESAKDSEQGLELLKEREKIDLLVIDWDNALMTDAALQLHPNMEVVLLTDRPVFERYGSDMMVLPMSSMIVSSFVATHEVNDPLATRELVTSVAKLFTDDIFGLEKYLCWGAAIVEHQLRESLQANEVVQFACDTARDNGMAERDISNLALLVDELLMNAIWDAPVDEQGVPKYADKSRAEPVDLLANETVTVRYGSDGNVFGLSVRDRFGRLEQDRAVRYIRKCFKRDDQQISYNAGGSGLGLYMAYNSVSSFVINVDPGQCTEVIGLIRLGRSRKAARGRDPGPRSLCYFRTQRSEKGE